MTVGNASLYPGVKRSGPEAEHSPTPSDECGSCTSTAHCLFVAWRLVKHRENFAFTFTGSASYRGAGKSLARLGRKQARKHVRDARDFIDTETRAIIKFFFSCKEIHAILTETLGCFLPDRAKDLSAPLYYPVTEFFLSTRSQQYLASDFMEPPGLYPCTEQSLCQPKSIHFSTLFI